MSTRIRDVNENARSLSNSRMAKRASSADTRGAASVRNQPVRRINSSVSNREIRTVKARSEIPNNVINKEVLETKYARPTGFRAGVRDAVWENAKDANGRVRDPVTGRFMSKDEPWDMGHKPGYEFRKHQVDAYRRGISREQFIEEYNNPSHYRPELPSSNRSHKGEDMTSRYFGF